MDSESKSLQQNELLKEVKIFSPKTVAYTDLI